VVGGDAGQRGLARQMGGDVTLASAHGGARFTLTLAACASPIPSAPAHAPPTAAGARDRGGGAVTNAQRS
jgi:hypothetical protein